MNKILFILLVSIFYTSCTIDKEDRLILSDTSVSISWDIQSISHTQSRKLIANNDELAEACISLIGGESIAIWGDFILNNQSSHEFKGTLLTCQGKNEKGNYIWDYIDEPDRYWWKNAIYDFRAYFPYKKMKNYTEVTNAAKIEVAYNTEILQEDLLVAFQQVDTRTWNLTDPVPLQMNHALAAIRFQFQAMNDATMYLKSFKLENINARGLSTSGILHFENDDVAISDWSLDEVQSGSFYEWVHPGGGVPFNRNGKATAYCAVNDITLGEEYTGNDGYLLIIPQTYNEQTKMIFTIDNKQYTVLLSNDILNIDEFLPGYQYNLLISVSADNSLVLTTTVQPWALKEEHLDYKQYVNMDTEGQLEWLSGSVERKGDTNEVFLNAESIQCTFHIATPEGATWFATLVPVDGNDMNAFSFVDTSGNETGLSISGKVGETATLSIKRKTIKEYTRMRLQLLVKDMNERTFMVHKDVLGSDNYIWCQP